MPHHWKHEKHSSNYDDSNNVAFLLLSSAVSSVNNRLYGLVCKLDETIWCIPTSVIKEWQFHNFRTQAHTVQK